jgi:hypothetical protein
MTEGGGGLKNFQICVTPFTKVNTMKSTKGTYKTRVGTLKKSICIILAMVGTFVINTMYIYCSRISMSDSYVKSMKYFGS